MCGSRPPRALRLDTCTARREREARPCRPSRYTGKAILTAHGFTIDSLVELIRAGLATASAERMIAGSKSIGIARVRITEARRRAIASYQAKE